MNDALDRADIHFQNGMAFVRRHDFNSAVEAFRLASEVWPSYGPSHNNLGSALAMLGRHEEAVRAFDGALARDPRDVVALQRKGESLQALGRRGEAIACLVRALEIEPALDEAHYQLGIAHQRDGKFSEALDCFRRSIELNPQNSDAFAALGGALMLLRAPGDAGRAFERALELDPRNAVARAHLLFLIAADCDWDRLEVERDYVPELGIVGDPVPPFNLLAFEDHPQRHRARSENFAAAAFASITPLPAQTLPASRPKRLRIGYFSADFREHATMFLAARMFELHDRERFCIHAYSYGRDEPGRMRDRALAAFDKFHDVQGLSDLEIAELARADGIDIAIDLKGYTEHHRLAIFAYRPAPIQISYLGYPGTLGCPFIDYLVADRHVVPEEQREAYSEKLILMPHCYQVNDDCRPIPNPTGVRADVGLPPDGFVFCCFNASYKITPVEFAIWMDLLNRVESSVLWLLARSAKCEANLRSEAAQRGIDPGRLVFAPKIQPQAHLARIQFADLFLDTFNCNAHTTASDALWVGLPLITKAGKGFAARVGVSLLHAIGLEELIANNEHDYAEKALELATCPEKLAVIRAKLGANRTTMPLFDSALFTRHLEATYDAAYANANNGQPPTDLMVSA